MTGAVRLLVLAADDEAARLVRLLERAGLPVEWTGASTPEAVEAAAAGTRYDAVLVGHPPAGASLEELLSRIPGRDGPLPVVCVAGAARPERPESEIPPRMATLLREAVAAQVRASRARREVEERYARLFDQAPIGIFHYTPDLVIRECNRQFVRLLRSRRELLVGLDMHTLRDRSVLPALEAATRGETGTYEGPYVTTTSGATIHALLRTAPVRDERGEVVGCIGLVLDLTERARDREALARRLHQLEVVARVAAALTSQLDVDAVLETAVREIHRGLGYHNVTLLLLDPASGELGRQAMAGAYEELAEPDYRQPVGVGLIGRAASTGKTQLARDTAGDPRYVVGFSGEIPTRSEVSVPVKLGERVLAVLDVQETRPDAFDDAEVMTLETIARQLAASLENARLFEELQRELEERRRVERSLRESEDRYRDLVENAHELIGHHALDGTILDMNRATLDVLGLPPGEVCGMNLRDLLAPRYRHEFEGYIARLREHGEDSGLMRVHLPDGTVRLWAYRSSLRTEGVEEPVVRALVRDVTEEWQARRRLEESERRYRELVERAGIGILLDGADGRIVYCNERVAELFGAQREELVGRPVWELVHPEDRERLREYHRRRIAGEPDVPDWYEVRVVGPDGRTRYVEVHAVPRREGGRVVGTRAYLRDVTERRELEQQLLQAQKLESVGRLAGGIAHDFNNLLQVIVAQLDQALLEVPGEGPLARRLGAARDAALRGGELVRQLLLFSRREKPAVERVELNALLRELHGMLSRLIGEDVRLELDLAEGELWLDADPAQIQQAVMNLVLNARDATPAGGRITVSTSRVDTAGDRPGLAPGTYAAVAVEDTGCGIADENLERIFDPFFTTKGPARGTGLGLATVHGIVQQHGGAIEVESEVGRGSRFIVYLPIATGAPTPSGARPRFEEAERPVPGEGELILAVEDDPGVREALTDILRLQGYRVEAVADGETALRRLEGRRGDVALLLVDVVLPGIGGVEVAARARELCPGLPVIFSSGYSEEQMDRELPLDERTLLLSKPYDIARLTAAVRHLLERESG